MAGDALLQLLLLLLLLLLRRGPLRLPCTVGECPRGSEDTDEPLPAMG